MPTLKTALASGGRLPPKAHLIHMALLELGEGEFSSSEVCAVLGYPENGRFRSRVMQGAKQLRAKGYIAFAQNDTVVAGPAYAKPVKVPKKGGRDAA